MFERFTDRARKVMAYANQEAIKSGHNLIDPGHILIGLLREGSGVGVNVLKNLDVDLPKVLKDASGAMKMGNPAREVGKLPSSVGAKHVIECAIHEARNLKHNYVGTEHLLLGLLVANDATTAKILLEHKVTHHAAREQVLDLLGAGPDKETRPGQAAIPDELAVNIASDDSLIYSLLVRFDRQIMQLKSRQDDAVADADYEAAAGFRSLILLAIEAKTALIKKMIDLSVELSPDTSVPESEGHQLLLRQLLAGLIESSPELADEFADVIQRLRKPQA